MAAQTPNHLSRRIIDMSGLSERLKREPEYRPYCLDCSTMRRMTLKPDGRTMWCEPVEDDTIAVLKKFGVPPRYGCGIAFDIETGKIVKEAAL